MLTIKHVAISGHETVRAAYSVHFDPAVGENNEYPKGQVLVRGAGAGPEQFDRFSYGIVYVMNDHGSTVAKYNLN